MPPNKAIGKIPVPPVDELKKGTNHLFAIGINTYKNFTRLNNAVKDVEDISNILVENYYFEQIGLLCDDEANRRNIINHLNGLRRKIKEEDRLLIYYSGHGQLEDGRGFWIPVDAEDDNVASLISNADVRDIIHSIKARHILLISDSCFSATLIEQNPTKEVNRTFVEWDNDPSRWVFTSGKGVVSDGKSGENSPFAKSFLKHLSQNKDEAIDIRNLADRITLDVRTNYEQHASIGALKQSGHDGGRFIFFKKQSERDDWQTALQLHTESAYLNYLDKYSRGEFVQEAKKKLNEIADEAEWRNATLRDSVFAYLQYLEKYPTGIHAEEATGKLNLIRTSEQHQAETDWFVRTDFNLKPITKLASEQHHAEIVRLERERLAKIEADKKEKELFEKTLLNQQSHLENIEKFAKERLKDIDDREKSLQNYNQSYDKYGVAAPLFKFTSKISNATLYVATIIVIIFSWTIKSLQETKNNSGKIENNILTQPTTIRQSYEPEMVFVQSGTFQMGSNDKNAESNEKPIHAVTLSSFQIGKYEVTQAQWKSIMGNNPSDFNGDNLPVENVSWEDVQEYLKKLNQKTGKKYRLPTEAEWEFAARGGTQSKKFLYSGSNDLNSVGWIRDNSGDKTHPIGEKQANELGIHDMSGNVWEWCNDWYDENYYKNTSTSNPQGASFGSLRVLRGGGWGGLEYDCRVKRRGSDAANRRYYSLGFRIVSSTPQ